MKLAMKHIDLPSMRLLVGACGLITLLALAPALVAQNAAQPVSGVRLAGHTPHKVLDGTAVRVSHYEPTQKLRLAIFVTPRDLAGQEKLLAELQDKKSPNFHKWLTAEEWNARFGPRVEDEQAVVDWAKSQGLTVTNRYANRMLVDVEAPSGVIEQTLSVTINHYQVGEEVDFSNDRDPSIPAHLSGIVGGIFGMNSIERLKPASSQRTEAKHPDYVPGPVFNKKISGSGEGDPSKAPWAQQAGIGGTGSGPHAQSQPLSSAGASNPNPPNELGGINPSNLYSSQGYDLNALYAVSKCCNVHNDSTGSPADTSIALVTFGGFNYSDYTTFTTHYGMAWNIDAYQIDGAASTATTDCQIDVTAPNSGCPGDGLDDEADLDTEWSTAFANSFGASKDTAHVYVYEGSGNYFSNFFDTWNYVLSDAHAHVISTSYAWTEESQQYYDPGWMTGTVNGDAHYVFNALVAQGNTLIAAAGDQGATSGCSNADQVFWPANDPDFLAAGGTSLTLNYDGSFGSETAWVGGSTLANCQNNGGGGGGGISQYFSAPSWQSGITYEEMVGGNDYVVSNQPNRMMPDMSLNATGNFQWDYCTTIGCQNDGVDGWGEWGGTSIVAPELAGFYAQVNSYLNSIGHICGSGTSACEPIGNPDPILYYEGMGQAAPHNPFYDTNQLCVTNYLTAQNINLTYFCATSGYDLATGWGSANLLQLAWAYNFYIIPSDGVPSVSFSGPATSTWYNSDQVVSWTVSDGVTAGTAGLPAPGVAGFTQGWDSIPADAYSEPNGGTGNSFYSGPQYPYATTGCLAFNGAGGCSGNPGQGCHTANVGAWDNQGFYTGAQTYGPVCYDTVAPTIAINTNVAPDSGLWFNIATGDPYVSLVATDPGGSNASGVKTIYGVLGPTSCSPTDLGVCQFYGPPFRLPQGANPITAFSLDNAGNFSNVAYTTLYVDTVAPVTTDSLVGQWNNGTSTSAVQVTLNATDATSGVESTFYTLDGGALTGYTGPFYVSSPGSHTLKYWSVDWATNAEAQNTATFAIKSPTTASVVAAPNPSMLGAPVTITATVVATLGGTPTGTVTFWNGATNLGTSTLSGGVASLTTSALPAGLLTLQATYNGATYFATTNSPPFDQTVQENTTTTVSISPNPLVYGQTSTISSTVTPAVSGTPTGNVTWYLGGVNIGTLPLISGVASISTAYFGELTPGAYSITATYSGDSTYLASGSSTFTLTVNKLSQTITFPAIATQAAATSVGLPATASSGLTVVFTSLTPSICSVSGAMASSLAYGSCTIQATQPGNSDYKAAPAVNESFWINHAAQAITFPPVPTQTALTSVGLMATASSGLTVSYTSTTPTVCSVSGTTASSLISGTCTIQATQAGNGAYGAAAPVSSSFWVNHATQTITFPNPGAQVALTSVTLMATASSGLTVSYTSTTPTICSVSGATASTLTSGTCTIQATQAGSGAYTAAPVVSQSFMVTAVAQTITFPAIPSPEVALTGVILSATASSGLTVSFASTTPTICSVSGTTASLLISGTCTIQATQAGNGVYSAAPAVSRSFTINHLTQTITFPAIPTQVAVTSVGLTATASSGLAVTYTSTTPTVCSVSGATASTLISGECTIWAAQTGNGDYSAAPAVNQSFWVIHATQTITFPTIPTQVVLTSVGLTATASSGLTVAYTSTTPTICSVSGTTASSLLTGTCTIQATQAGSAAYAPAPAVNKSFTVTLAPQTITFPTIATQVALTSVGLTATASSGLTVTYTSTTPTICSVSGTTASSLISGTCTIQATQTGNTVYAAAPAVNVAFWINHATQTITFPAIATQVALTSVGLSATASSGLTVTYTSSTPTVCTVSGTTASTLISGTCTIQATQPGNGAYAAAAPVSSSFWVNHATQTITFPNPGPQSGVPSLSLAATASSGLTVSFVSTTPTVCTVAAGGSTTASLLIGGTCSIQATQAGNTAYSPAPAVNQSFTVSAP